MTIGEQAGGKKHSILEVFEEERPKYKTVI